MAASFSLYSYRYRRHSRDLLAFPRPRRAKERPGTVRFGQARCVQGSKSAESSKAGSKGEATEDAAEKLLGSQKGIYYAVPVSVGIICAGSRPLCSGSLGDHFAVMRP